MSEASFPATAPRVLVFEIAVPGYHLDDWDEVQSYYEEYTQPVDTLEMIEQESGVCSPDVRLGILIGGKDGYWIETVGGRLVGARVVERTPEHELSGDERVWPREEDDE